MFSIALPALYEMALTGTLAEDGQVEAG